MTPIDVKQEKISGKYLKKDGCLSWVVCLTAFLTNAVITGIDSSFGETIGSIISNFNSTEGEVTWIGSVHSSTQYYAAFAASPLANYFGFGPVTLVGALLATLSFGLAATSSNISTLIATYGLFGGIGLGLAYTPANIVCAFHFEKKRALAISLSNSGSGMGIVVIAFFLNIINSKYGWKGSVLLCTSIAPITLFLALVVWLIPIDGIEGAKSNEATISAKEGKSSKVGLL